MNIAAAMATLKIDDLDHTAKMARLVLACHADRSEAKATLTIESVAGDLGLDYGTTWRALQRAIGGGYVAVDNPAHKHPGKARTWQLTSRMDARPSSRDNDRKIARLAPKDRAPTRDIRIFKDLKKESAPALEPRKTALAGAVEKTPPDVAPVPPHRAGMPPELVEAGRRALGRRL